jgi:hypothetical protein
MAPAWRDRCREDMLVYPGGVAAICRWVSSCVIRARSVRSGLLNRSEDWVILLLLRTRDRGARLEAGW